MPDSPAPAKPRTLDLTRVLRLAAPPMSIASTTSGPMQRIWSAPYLLLTLTPLFWAGNFVLGRAVHASVPPVALAFWRWTGAFVLVIGFAWPHLKRDWPAL